MEDPESRLESAFIEEFLRSRGYDSHTVQALPDREAKHILEAASTYAASKLAEVEARAQFVHHLHHED